MKAFIFLVALSIEIIVGGYSDRKPMEHDVLQLANGMRDIIEQSSQQPLGIYIPLEFRSQVVAGTNYKVSIQIEDDKYLLATIYVPLGQQPALLTDLSGGLSLDELDLIF